MVVPSVSLALVLQRTDGTVLVEIPSSATLSKPVCVPGSIGLPSAGAAFTVGGDGGGVVEEAASPAAVPGACWATPETNS